MLLFYALQALKGGWALDFDSRKLGVDAAAELASSIQRLAVEPSFKSAAAGVSALLRAHPRPSVERAAGGRGVWTELHTVLQSTCTCSLPVGGEAPP